MNVFVFPFFLWAVQPRLYRFWCLLVCVLQIFFGLSSPQFPKNPGGNIQPTDPKKTGGTVPLEGISSLQIPKNHGGNIQPTDPKKPGGTVPQKILEGISSLQILKKLEGLLPQKTWRKYAAYRHPKIMEGISSLQIPKNVEGLFPNPGGNIQPTDPKKIGGIWRDYPVHTSQKKPGWRDYPVHSSKKNWRDYPVHTSQKKPGGTIQSTVPEKLEGLSSPQFPKKPCRDYPVHTSPKKKSTVAKKLEGLSSPQFPKKNLEGLSSSQFPKNWRDYPVHSSKKKPGAFSPSAGLRFAKPSLHRSVPGFLPAVLVPAVFFWLPSQAVKKKGSPAKNLEGSVRPKANLFQFGFQPTHFPNPPIAIALQPHAALHCLIPQPGVVGNKAEVVASSADTDPSSRALHCKPVIP